MQCRLEDKSKEIITKAKKQSLTTSDVRAAVSTMTLMARNLDTPCPQTEITRMRKETFIQIDQRLAEHDSRFRFLPNQEPDPKTRFPTDFSKSRKF